MSGMEGGEKEKNPSSMVSLSTDEQKQTVAAFAGLKPQGKIGISNFPQATQAMNGLKGNVSSGSMEMALRNLGGEAATESTTEEVSQFNVMKPMDEQKVASFLNTQGPLDLNPQSLQGSQSFLNPQSAQGIQNIQSMQNLQSLQSAPTADFVQGSDSLFQDVTVMDQGPEVVRNPVRKMDSHLSGGEFINTLSSVRAGQVPLERSSSGNAQ